MIKEIQAKTMLSRVKGVDDWFGLYYNMNLYRGCQHQCIYCDSRSECYQIENFNDDVLVKSNAIDLLQRELPSKRMVGTIGTGSMNDPYMPLERQVQLTRRALETIARFHFPVHVITKSDLVLRDLDLLADIHSHTFAAVSFTVTTAEDDLSRKLEPGAPVSSQRLKAMQVVRSAGIRTGLLLMPVLPFIEDGEQNITHLTSQAAEHGAEYILSAFGMTLRDRQREYFYARLDRQFPGTRQRYEKAFTGCYSARSPNASRLEKIFDELCSRHGIARRMPRFTPRPRQSVKDVQPQLFS